MMDNKMSLSPRCTFTVPDPENTERKVCSQCGFTIVTNMPQDRISAMCSAAEHLWSEAHKSQIRIGVGIEFHRLLHKFRLFSVQGCKCDQRAQAMDSMGPDWCEKNLDVIVGWLQEEAVKRHLPFLQVAGRILVRRAISNARRRLKILGRDK